jgi:hypothetical protein
LMERNERDEPMDQRELAAASVPPVPMPPSMARPTGSGPVPTGMPVASSGPYGAGDSTALPAGSRTYHRPPALVSD